LDGGNLASRALKKPTREATDGTTSGLFRIVLLCCVAGFQVNPKLPPTAGWIELPLTFDDTVGHLFDDDSVDAEFI
jgi:hypothetical protein